MSTEILYHPFQPFIIGQKLVASKLALQLKIPLIFYGENESEYGNPISDTETALRGEEYFKSDSKDLYLGGTHIDDLINNYGISKNELSPYLPLRTKNFEKIKIETHYLGYYLRWHPQACYYYAVENGGFEASPERTTGTYSKYTSIDDKIDDLHFYTTGIKFGIGRATHEAAQEIRSGDIDRDEGISLVKRYDHEYPERFKKELFSYLSIDKKEFPIAYKMFEKPLFDEEYFINLTDNFRSPHIWTTKKNKIATKFGI